MKKFIMYGAGNIGRGFIGQLFSENGFKVGFIDINKEVIDRLNADKRYPVNIVQGDNNTEVFVESVYGIDGNDVETVAEEIASCDIMATAIGVNVLKYIAKPIALAIKKRAETSFKPLNIIICENLIGADEYLKGLIEKEIPTLKDYIESNVGFVEASIGRMVPVMTAEKKEGNPLRVYVEPYNILPVDKDAFKGEIPNLNNLYPFSPFNLFIQRKLFMHNMSHALCAYLGYLRDYEYIYEAVGDYDIRYVAYKALTEMAVVLSKENNTDIKELVDHTDNLLFRFQNKALGDTVARVGKDTIRKLGPEDRLIGALKLSEKHKLPCDYICIGIAAGLLFNPGLDERSIELSEFCLRSGVKQTLKQYSEYEGDKAQLIEKLYLMMKSGKQLNALIKYCDNLSNTKIRI